MPKIVGRTSELKILKEAYASSNSELIALYGRRRIGKTFLIREFYTKSIAFEVTGLYGGNMNDQLSNFTKELKNRTGKSDLEIPSSWLDAFTLLEGLLIQ